MTRRQKALLASAAAAVTAATVLLWPDPHHPAAAPPPPPPSASPTPSPTPTKTYPYPFYPVNTCFLIPSYSDVKDYTVVPCDQPHDAQTVAAIKLPEGLTDNTTLGRTLVQLCKPVVEEVEKRQNGGGPYFNNPIGPLMGFYNEGYRDVNCTVTFSQWPKGPHPSTQLR
ncbi:hypothetical protein [Kitasatospora sp. NPDC088134]|uniref:hypothetical protein n=1 Tax=Kitasatospora sp. NPDC088134 TaxID=3364071 RepID=UPI0037F9AD83